ncbi:hypothetical protein IQ247_25955 [Plectonema cf. radiosum LEGE 06105]|uniref:Uncharacterized protein n=1 Tax=Plectonema cf. radiosum LEGE 06105 TaxID=945769 RepID=A0A8J7FCQ0_9CYAN|nr:hypothetical protein [Plectonema radiosum]MBE9216064.1 hypothetical protein [Plectonema cf. radiosum LEGE 06105]
MQTRSNPLFVIINPPGIQYGMPGETVEIHVVVINEGQQSAVIDLFFAFDQTFEKISNWSNSPRASLAIAPGESSDEVTFELDIPVDALPGTYDYTLVVDSPEHYPQDTPINFPGQIKVLLKEQTVIRANDPTFLIQPTTNPNKPLIYKPDRLLQVTVKVENRSTRVDRFHLTCAELDEDFLKISYPETGVEATGLVEVSALELNPISEGQILLEFRPPANILAGNYSPTIRLHSENHPELVLLDLVYIQIPSNYQLSIELNTILGKVSRKPGKYQLAIINQGNFVRELYFSAISRDEEEICIYQFEPAEVKLLPSKSALSNLTVKPQPWWRRRWIGQPATLNFQIDVRDKQNLPVPNTLPQGVLLWKARPWWQFLLLILLGLGLAATAAFLIWRLLNPDPFKIESFSVEDPTIIEGNQVLLNWKISRYQQLKSLVIRTKQPASKQPLLNETDIINSPIIKGKNPPCRNTSQGELICENFKTGITAKGKYVFEMTALPRKRMWLSSQIQSATDTTDVEIQEKPIAEIADFKTDKAKYQKGEDIVLSWSVQRPELLDKIEIITKLDDKNPVGKPITFDNPTIKDKCQEQGKQIKCTIPLPATTVGNFSYELTAYTKNVNGRVSTKKVDNIEVIAKPFNIVFFKINGSEQLNQVLNEGDQAILTWKVEGEDIQVKLRPYGREVTKVGQLELKVIKDFLSPIILEVTDISGKTQQKVIAVSVEEKPTPTPTPFKDTPIPSPINKKPF